MSLKRSKSFSQNIPTNKFAIIHVCVCAAKHLKIGQQIKLFLDTVCDFLM